MADRITLADIRLGVAFFVSLPSFLRSLITLEEARDTVQRRLRSRAADFLSLAERAIYKNPASPYLALLRIAGCEYGDLEQQVRRSGVEGALAELFRRGVYLTVDEFRGLVPVVRGSRTLHFGPEKLFNPLARFQLAAASSGTRGRPAVVPIDLKNLRQRAATLRVALEARGGAGWKHALWAIPGGSVMSFLLQYGVMGIPMARWYSQIDPDDAALHQRYAWSSRVLRWGGRLGGVPMPPPAGASIDQPAPLLDWMRDVRGRHETPHLLTFPSSAVRLCQFAGQTGTDLEGAEFSLGGEPVTAARLATVRQAGARAAPHYGAAESGPIGEACLAPEFPDEVHLFDDLLALIQAGGGASLPSAALLISSLRDTCPVVLLNVSMGDEAAVSLHRCGCPMEHAGWNTRLHSIRSYEKLTAAGMTFVDSRLMRVLDEVLPARFGGSPADYQLVEEEDDAGNARLTLLVHPALLNIDPNAVTGAFLAEIGAGAGAEKIMQLFWRQADVLRVVRARPIATSTGKILHLHVARARAQ